MASYCIGFSVAARKGNASKQGRSIAGVAGLAVTLLLGASDAAAAEQPPQPASAPAVAKVDRGAPDPKDAPALAGVKAPPRCTPIPPAPAQAPTPGADGPKARRRKLARRFDVLQRDTMPDIDRREALIGLFREALAGVITSSIGESRIRRVVESLRDPAQKALSHLDRARFLSENAGLFASETSTVRQELLEHALVDAALAWLQVTAAADIVDIVTQIVSISSPDPVVT